MYISIQNLGLFILFFIIVIAGLYLIISLNNFNKVLVLLRNNINENENNFRIVVENMAITSENLNEITTVINKNKSIFEESLPEAILNINSMSKILKDTSEKVDKSLDIINYSLVEAATTLQENTNDIFAYIKVISDTINLLLNMFNNKK